jgi:hypothetical protein
MQFRVLSGQTEALTHNRGLLPQRRPMRIGRLGAWRLAQVGHHQEAELGRIDRLGAPHL